MNVKETDKQVLTKILPGIDDETADLVVARCAEYGVTTETLANASKAIAEAARKIARTFAEFAANFSEAMRRLTEPDQDLLQAITENPRQAHLSYYAKKERTRKKNQHILERKAEKIRRNRQKSGGESMARPYTVCPNCGSHLDPCERCDCQKPQNEYKEDEAHDNRSESAEN